MSAHAFFEYIKYRLKARSRHGVHSPFVYALIENVLNDKSRKPLQEKLAVFLNTGKIIQIDSEDPATWAGALKEINHEETVLLFPGIHSSPSHSTYWAELVADKRVKLSVDLYSTGLLFFRNEFKEKQHFVLQY